MQERFAYSALATNGRYKVQRIPFSYTRDSSLANQDETHLQFANFFSVVSSSHCPHGQMPVGVAMGGRGSPSLAVTSPKGLLRFEQLSKQELMKLNEEREMPVYQPKRGKHYPAEDPSLLPQTFRPKERVSFNPQLPRN